VSPRSRQCKCCETLQRKASVSQIKHTNAEAKPQRRNGSFSPHFPFLNGMVRDRRSHLTFTTAPQYQMERSAHAEAEAERAVKGGSRPPRKRSMRCAALHPRESIAAEARANAKAQLSIAKLESHSSLLTSKIASQEFQWVWFVYFSVSKEVFNSFALSSFSP